MSEEMVKESNAANDEGDGSVGGRGLSTWHPVDRQLAPKAEAECGWQVSMSEPKDLSEDKALSWYGGQLELMRATKNSSAVDGWQELSLGAIPCLHRVAAMFEQSDIANSTSDAQDGPVWNASTVADAFHEHVSNKPHFEGFIEVRSQAKWFGTTKVPANNQAVEIMTILR